jgi:hypothetical protein
MVSIVCKLNYEILTHDSIGLLLALVGGDSTLCKEQLLELVAFAVRDLHHDLLYNE